MTVDDFAANHRLLSEADWRFRELAFHRRELCARASFESIHDSKHLLVYRQQSWPTFVRKSLAAELGEAAVRLSGLIRGVPERVFGFEPSALCDFYRLDNPGLLEIVFEPPNALKEAVARADFILGAEGFRCIEFNMGADLGGWESGYIAELHRANPATARALADLGLVPDCVDTFQVLAEHVLTEVRDSLGVTDEALIVIAADEFANTNRAATEEYLGRALDRASRGVEGLPNGRLFVCEPRELQAQGGVLRLHGETVHAVVEAHQLGTPPAVFRAFKMENLKLFNGPVSRILSDKRNLAALSDPRWSGCFTAEERDVVERFVPWTRVVADETTRYRDEEVPLLGLLEGERERFVLKIATLSGGQEVYVGSEIENGIWQEAVRRAATEGMWVAQEAVVGLEFLQQSGEQGYSPHRMIWSPFVFGSRYGGTIVRAQESVGSVVVNLSLRAAEAVVFVVDE